jgi:hypothetical protein
MSQRIFGPKVQIKMQFIENWFLDHPEFENDFLKSVLEQYQERGSLSEKQWEIINRIALESEA